MATSDSIEFIGPDPRIFQSDMYQVWVGHDPRDTSAYWNKVEKALGVRAGQATKGQDFQCRILLALETWEEPDRRLPCSIVDRASADNYLREESKYWSTLLDKSSIFSNMLEPAWYQAEEKYAPELPPICPADVITTRLDRTAVGFWLIEQAVFPDPDDDPFTRANHAGKTVVKMVGQHPEICLFDL